MQQDICRTLARCQGCFAVHIKLAAALSVTGKLAACVSCNMPIIGQAIYQLVITLLLYYGSPTILAYDTPAERSQLNTLVFNTFVWMQIFNQWK